MSTRGRRWLLVGLALAVALALSSLWGLTPDSPLEAARRRVRLGTGEAAVVRAVGRPADHVVGRRADVPGGICVLLWEEGATHLLVEFDRGGRAVKVDMGRLDRPPWWARVRARLGF
jgi:hypothetical protein